MRDCYWAPRYPASRRFSCADDSNECGHCGRTLVEVPRVDGTTGQIIETILECPRCLSDLYIDEEVQTDGRISESEAKASRSENGSVRSSRQREDVHGSSDC